MSNEDLLALGFELPDYKPQKFKPVSQQVGMVPSNQQVNEDKPELVKRKSKSLGIGKWLATAWVIVPIIASGFGIGASVRTMERAIAAD